MPKPTPGSLPEWFEDAVPPASYRSLFKWGAPDQFKHPNYGLVNYLKNALDLNDSGLGPIQYPGLDPVPLDLPIQLGPSQACFFESVVGAENIRRDPYSRIKKSYGAGMIDSLRLRRHRIENIPDLVVAPRTKQEIATLINYCSRQRLPVYVFGGGSTVTRGMEAVCGGITLDMSQHLNQVVAFNETDQTITVQAGMSGPQLEAALNAAPERYQAKRRYTCGHFPQSFPPTTVKSKTW